MLHWLAGQKPPEGPPDPDATESLEPPETPAPVFAVRAFKHAIWGTPQTTQPNARRYSNTEHVRPRAQGPRADRPPLAARPKSAGDARGLRDDREPLVPEPVASPTKGILLTPGTATAKRKTVSFGDHVNNNEAKRPVKTGLPDDCPGKFPSPWSNAGADNDDLDEHAEKGAGSGKLTRALEQAREESVERTAKMVRHDEAPDADGGRPVRDCCKAWKTQYDSYRESSQREIRKLIVKHKAAKSFAKEKDFQCTDLADQLRIEKKRAEKLEKRTAELEAQIEAMQARVMEVDPKGLASVTARGAGSASGLQEVQPDQQPQTGQLSAAEKQPLKAKASTSTPSYVAKESAEVEKQTSSFGTQTRARQRSTGGKPKTDDLWDQSFAPSSLAGVRPIEQRAVSPKAGRAVTSGTCATPLKSLSVNTMPTTKLTRRDSAQPSPPADRFAKEPLIRQEVIQPATCGNRGSVARNDSPILSSDLPEPSAKPITAGRATSMSPTPRKAASSAPADDPSVAIPASSPFDLTPSLSPVRVDGKTTSYFDRISQQAAKPSAVEAKDPVGSAVSRPNMTETIKPTAAWNAINAPNVGRRVTSLTDRNGKELDQARMEAAKARLAARGRVVS
ncbi:hypothetical protein BAUCODRAFT_155923 [Baudoinia panamericana UAMH 10762]|uniref:Spindle pole body-associated protein cut12 domain-containing protein n=1 Tax=Baudoinia panamericana (strain UAMH 10762) TaxID=717646 RepID=M2ND70_BAUPA|nr:uncharacterized protein BAUCODRAFT_155923 [Baudoinia panamericana UAMH 10762]EMC97154.1 hypothetical protein BAUCODRAFT_155923 [Baudoinia panamericana UAMH 10762]